MQKSRNWMEKIENKVSNKRKELPRSLWIGRFPNTSAVCWSCWSFRLQTVGKQTMKELLIYISKTCRIKVDGKKVRSKYLGWINETLAKRVIWLRHVGQRFDQNLDTNVGLELGRNQLIQLQDSQICFQIIKVFLKLKDDVIFELLQIVRIVPWFDKNRAIKKMKG